MGFDGRYRDRKGSVFVEAAMILPLLILALSLVITYGITRYEEVKNQIAVHEQDREASMRGEDIDKGEGDFIRKIDFLTEGD